MTKVDDARELVAVLHSNGIYKMTDGKVYRFSLGPYPTKKHHYTGYLDLKHLLDKRPGAVPLYSGDSVTIQF